MNQVRVRFAPSPTGSLHVGGARTALYNMLFARANGGKFILRVEDTDQERSTDEALQAQIRDLKWLGFDWDEGPDIPGEYGPYRQSDRLDIYSRYANDLINSGKAFYCFLTDIEIEEFRAKKQPWNSPYRDLPLEKAKAMLADGKSATIRFRAPEDVLYSFDDMVRGRVELSSKMIGDFVILRSDGMPVYNFCCAIDDFSMQISHVFRGEEHLSNSLRQLMIYEAIGAKAPQFGHLSIILGSDKKKLSKRQGAVSCDFFRVQGYLPEALLNYIAFLGWSPKTEQEIFSLQELIAQFKPNQLNAAAPIFDLKKLDWLNSMHIRALPKLELIKRLESFGCNFANTDQAWQLSLIELIVSDATSLKGLLEAMKPYLEGFIWEKPSGFDELLSWSKTREIWQSWLDWLLEYDVVDRESVSSFIKKIQVEHNVKGKQLFMPLRVAVIGSLNGADVRLAAPIINKKFLIERVKLCLGVE